MWPLDPAVIALIGTLCGGVGLKLLEHWLSRSKIKIDEAGKIRDELRVEVNALRQENKTLEAEVDKWRLAYYDLREKQIKESSDNHGLENNHQQV